MMYRVSFILSVALLALVAPRPTRAAAGITFELVPKQPRVGQAVGLIVHTWWSDTGGRPNLAQPLDMSGYPFSIRAYQAAEFVVHGASETEGFAIDLTRAAGNRWHAQLVFPEPGDWIIVFRNWYPPLTRVPPPPETPATLDVVVHPLSQRLPSTGGVGQTRLYLLWSGLLAVLVGTTLVGTVHAIRTPR